MMRYPHNCPACTELGTHEEFDVYACPSDGGTIVARFSSEPSGYASLTTDVLKDWYTTGYRPGAKHSLALLWGYRVKEESFLKRIGK